MPKKKKKNKPKKKSVKKRRPKIKKKVRKKRKSKKIKSSKKRIENTKDKKKVSTEVVFKTKQEWIKNSIANKSQYQNKYNESIKNNNTFWKKRRKKNYLD